ncbi:hypothetical protein EIP91_008514 [Steccherinum ochraceum]|uniref:Uncharacterized protein n=1 Tax=Steccherinum ochraceum TaxID=92696 RepID=A0A4R0R2T1_9APHY|nr:hypothetical protein EIP91_008514 [Steccherinum ochraceum]
MTSSRNALRNEELSIENMEKSMRFRDSKEDPPFRPSNWLTSGGLTIRSSVPVLLSSERLHCLGHVLASTSGGADFLLRREGSELRMFLPQTTIDDIAHRCCHNAHTDFVLWYGMPSMPLRDILNVSVNFIEARGSM